MIVADILFIVLFVYLLIYGFYRLSFFIKAKDIDKYFEINEKTRSINLDKKRLCVIVYANLSDKNLDKLLDILNNQTYDKEDYEVHVVFEKAQNDTTPDRDFAMGAKFHNIKNPDFFSKDKAINLLVNKFIPEKEFDCYIFLDADRIVGEKYLENINKTVLDSGVYIGSKVPLNNKDSFAKKIKNSILASYLKYLNRTNNIVRSMFELPFLIDEGNVVITSDVLEKMGYVGLEDKDSALEFSYDLASNNIKSTYSPYIISAIDVKNYDFSSPSIKNKISLFLRYFPLLIFKSNSFKEFVLFLLKPNALVVIFAFAAIVAIAIISHTMIVKTLTAILILFALLNLIVAVNVSKMNISEVFWLGFYPLCLSWQKIKILINNLTMRSIIEGKYEEENINSATISAVANNGKKDFVCKLDLVSEDGMRKVVFREGGKFIRTDSHLRMYDALNDIAYKLKTKGLTLKTCQNCSNFTLCPDGTLDCLNGKCQISGNDILVWNGCQYFSPNKD